MEQSWGYLYLEDPLADCAAHIINDIHRHTLIFSGSEGFLVQAQAALYALRLRHAGVSVLARGAAAGVACALGEQLPVEQVVLVESLLFSPLGRAARKRSIYAQMARLNAYARRNLALMVAPTVLINCSEAERHSLLAGLNRHIQPSVYTITAAEAEKMWRNREYSREMGTSADKSQAKHEDDVSHTIKSE